jgi:DNA-binding MarR family transcriptional regulator
MMTDRSPTPDDPPARRIGRECLAVRVRLLSRVLTRVYDDALKPLGLTANQLGILAVVENLSAAQPGDVGRLLQMEKSTVSRNVERMRRHGWLAEQPGADARRVVLTATGKGRALLRKALPFWAEAQGRVRELLGEAGVASITGLADRFLPRPGAR